MLSSRVAAPPDRTWILAAGGLIVAAILFSIVGPQSVPSIVVGTLGLTAILVRPAWGIAIILAMLLVQYGGGRAHPREGEAFIATLLPGGTGLVTINNVLGIFLGVLLIYQIYRTSDWSFLRNRQVQLILAVTTVLTLSSLVSPVDYEALNAYGLRAPGQDPVRLILSRALFVVLFVSFIHLPRELRLIVGVFLALALATALSASTDALSSGAAWKERVPTYRAGGTSVLIESGANPNRLAMICTMAIALIWEYSRTQVHRWRGWITTPAILLLVVTVFLSASRGGVIGLAFASLLLLSNRRANGGNRFFFGVLVVGVGYMLVTELVPTPNWERLSSIPGLTVESSARGGSIDRRQYTVNVAFDMIRQNPILGVGLGNWDTQRVKVDLTRSSSVPHNSYLLAWAEGGIVALLLYLLLFFVTIQQLRAIERDPEAMHRAQFDGVDWLVPAMRVCLMSFMIFSLFADLWELIFLYLLVSIAAVLIRSYGEHRQSIALRGSI